MTTERQPYRPQPEKNVSGKKNDVGGNCLNLERCELPQPEPSELDIKKHFDGTPFARECSALLLRIQGLTLKAIGEELGVGPQRARELISRSCRLLRRPIEKDSLNFLSVRVRNTLRSSGFKDPQSIKRGIASGEIYPGFAPNFGAKAYEELFAWLGWPAPSITQPPNPATVRKYIRYLESHGYQVAVPQEATQ